MDVVLIVVGTALGGRSGAIEGPGSEISETWLNVSTFNDKRALFDER
jgi:hypothetical protein